MPMSVADMRAAKQVTVVRVRSTGVPSDPYAGYGIARVEVLDHLKGEATPQTLRYGNGPCCPLRIEAGKDYIVFAERMPDQVDVNLGNIVIVSPWPGVHYRAASAGRHWREILAGRRALDVDSVEMRAQWLDGWPPPPSGKARIRP